MKMKYSQQLWRNSWLSCQLKAVAAMAGVKWLVSMSLINLSAIIINYSANG
jgi:hypothetical protein